MKILIQYKQRVSDPALIHCNVYTSCEVFVFEKSIDEYQPDTIKQMVKIIMSSYIPSDARIERILVE